MIGRFLLLHQILSRREKSLFSLCEEETALERPLFVSFVKMTDAVSRDLIHDFDW